MTAEDNPNPAASAGQRRIDALAAARERRRVAELEARLREAEETLDAIRNGDVDALVVSGASGQQVYTLENADRPYRVLVEQMQEGAVTVSGEGIILYCNPRFSTLLGMARERLAGLELRDFLADEDHARIEAILDRGSGSGEFTLMTVVGGAVPVNISMAKLEEDGQGGDRMVCAIVTDLTQNRHRRLELAAANERLAVEIGERRRAEDSLGLALDAAGMGSWDLDLKTGAIRRSPRHDAIFGHPRQLLDWSLETTLAHFLPEDRVAVEAAFAGAVPLGVVDVERPIRRAGDQAVRWIHLKGRTTFEHGRPVRIAGVVTDITERREIDEQLRQSQKMEAVGQLTGGIAHDFNNLLMIIGGSLEMLARRVPGDAKTERLFAVARQGVARGAELNRQLLAFSRRQDLRAEAVCVDDLIPTFEHLLDRAIGEAVQVRIERAPKTWFCLTDPHQLEIAILNLAINARDAMPGGGTLTLATENRRVSHDLAEAWDARPGDYVVVVISDTGGGIAPEVLPRVFEPFFTTKEVGKGTGLGLSQVYGFARQSGGFVLIESKLGQGTRVLIHLPRTERPEPVKEPARLHPTGDADPDAPPHGTILVVEDDPQVRATASAMLTDLGYQVREAQTARAALAALTLDPTIDLVFSDVIMPDGMSGIELAQELGRRRPGLPMLLTSGYTALGFSPGTDIDDVALLRKPYRQAELALAVSAALGSKRGLAGAQPADLPQASGIQASGLQARASSRIGAAGPGA